MSRMEEVWADHQFRPAPRRKTPQWIIIDSEDLTCWVVIGERCAARVNKMLAETKLEAFKYALDHPDLWVFDDALEGFPLWKR